MDTIEILNHYIVDELVPEFNLGRLDESQSLFETGVLDSMGILKLIAFIEEKFKICVGDEEETPENFETLLSMAEMISRMQRVSSQSTPIS
jgi:acyl carrier protein